MEKQSSKPLGHRAYGSIGHLPGSRMGSGDHHVPEGQADICTVRTRDLDDHVVVQEKLDGTNVAVARIDGQILPLVRAGYIATTSPYEQHHLFARWVEANEHRFNWLDDGKRVSGEWLAQAHGTRYRVDDEPFVAFDILSQHDRMLHSEFIATIGDALPTVTTIHIGGALSIADAMALLGTHGFHGALDPVEGVVWRVERNGRVEFLAKYVRPDKVDGKYLPDISEGPTVWNWSMATPSE